MIRRRSRQRGVSMVEIAISLVIVSVLMAVAVPSFGRWIQNQQIRTAAESVQNGLQRARGEAVQRNAQVRFQLTSDLTNTCALSTTAVNWVVSLNTPVSLCATAPSDLVSPFIVEAQGSAEVPNVTMVAGQSTVIFNGLGRVTPATAAFFTFSNATGGACATIATPSNPMRCLRVAVSAGGQIRLCDPAKAVTIPPDPQAC